MSAAASPVLAIDTALDACAVAVWADGAQAVRAVPMRTGHAEALFGLIDAVCEDAGLTLSAVARIAVTTGPGTFTGTRVGLAAAKGLAFAGGLDCFGLTTLAACALTARTGEIAPQADHYAVAMDARQGLVCCQVFTASAEPEGDAAVLPAGEAAQHLAALTGTVSLSGTGADLLRAAAPELSLLAGAERPDPMVLARHVAGLSDPAGFPAEPFYSRPPDAVKAAPPVWARRP